MTFRAIPTRLLLRLCAVALLLAIPARGFAAERHVAGWQAVLVAGDNAEPVFDNAVAAMARWLGALGVPPGDIHRLSATEGVADPASGQQVVREIEALRPRPGQGCFVFITSHGQYGEGVWLAASGEFLRPADLAQALSVGCAAAPTVVIVSSCYSGAFAAGPMRASNRVVLTAARADRPSFGCQADRTFTVFDECLLASLPQAGTWRAAYAVNSACVRSREARLSVRPSVPQAFFGAQVRDLALR